MRIKTDIGNKFGALIMTLLIVASIAPLCLASTDSESGEPFGECYYPEVPGVPENAVQYNKTDLTPVAEMEQVAAGEPALFQYKNMTMLMNCSQNCDIIFTADQEVTPKTFGLSIEPKQNMTLTVNMYCSPLQGVQTMERTLNFYLSIEPNAEVKHQAQIKLLINQTELNQELNRVVNASRLTWMYWNQTRASWETVESYMDQNGYLICNTNHFSTWTVAELADDIKPSDDATSGGIPAEYVYIGVTAIAVVIVIAAVFAYKKYK